MAGEDRWWQAGKTQLIVTYRGWRICPMVCYDLRFPVWSRNVDNGYDVLLYVANWPEARQSAWKTLLKARAIENMAYVCGVNRIGTDFYDISYHGGSMCYSPRGKKRCDAVIGEEVIHTCTLSFDELHALRTKFPTWMDADRFQLL